jgi:Fe2+ or Zn2+ uptake regulation protein
MSLKENLKNKGIRLSKPRLMVLEFFEQNKEGHFSIYEIYEELKKQNKKISFTSVYRSCKLLERLGYIRPISFEERHIHYESNLNPHIHFQCVSCGKVEEKELKDLSEISKIIKIEDTKFIITSIKIQVLGICEECQKKQRRES